MSNRIFPIRPQSFEIMSSEPRVRIAADRMRTLALLDLWQGLKRHELWWTFAIHEIKQRFRRSVLGPFWLTLSMGFFIAVIGLVMSHLFGQDVARLLPYISISIVLWTLFSTLIIESCTAFVAAEGFVRNVPVPLSVHFYRMVARNILVFLHNAVICLVALAFAPVAAPLEYLAAILGFAIFVGVAASAGFLIALASTRFRDIPPIVTSLLQVVFFVTPIFWSVDLIPTRPAFVEFNPIFHLHEVVRAPLLGHLPSLQTWFVSIGLLVTLVPVAIYAYCRTYSRIPYWV